MATWLIQSNLLDPVQIGQICDALKERCYPYYGCKIIPFVDDIECFWTDGEPTHKNIIPYGSSKLSRLANTMGWTGMFFNLDQFRVDTWNTNRDDMLNSDAEFMTVADLEQRFAGVPDDEVFHIRPMEDLKAFNGTVTTAKEIRRWQHSDDAGNFSFKKTTQCVVSPPKKILAEWRWFIADGKIISGSTYKMNGQRLVQRETDQDVIDEAQAFADKWLPDEVCVMDIALTDDGPKVIEFNCFNSSGFYYHDIGAVVEAVTSYVDNH
jgi:hypothetical protein